MEDVISAYCMLCPTLTALIYTVYISTTYKTIEATIGVALHLPFSFTFHMYRAHYRHNSLHVLLYKLDVIFIHIYSIITCHALDGDILWYYHLICIYNIITCPHRHKQIELMTALGLWQSTLRIYEINKNLWYICNLSGLWCICLFNGLIGNTLKSAMFHIMLSVPQLCIMLSLKNNE